MAQAAVANIGVPEWEHLMNDTVKIEPPDGTFDATGNPNYLASVSYKGYIEDSVKQVKDKDGIERVSSKIIILNTVTRIDPVSRLTLPVGMVPNQPTIINSYLAPGPSGPHHVEIIV